MRWIAMKKRCLNPSDRGYKNYGGRGITVCDSWKNSFEAFYRDMGPCPPGLELDRIDNNGPYEPGNCHWTTRTQNQHNTRKNRWLTIDGETKILAEWAVLVSTSHRRIQHRLKAGWPVKEAVFGPSQALTNFQKSEIQRLSKIMGTRKIAKVLKVGRSTVQRVIRQSLTYSV